MPNRKADIIKEQVVKILAGQLGFEPEEIKPESLLKAELLADSLDDVEIMVLLEDEFSIELGYAKICDWKTVQDILDTLNREL